MSGSGIKLGKCKTFCVERGSECVMGEKRKTRIGVSQCLWKLLSKILFLTQEGEIQKEGSPPQSSCNWHTIWCSVRLWLVVTGSSCKDHANSAHILLLMS